MPRRSHFRFALLLTALWTHVTAAQANRHPDRRYVDQSIPVTSSVKLAGPRRAAVMSIDVTPSASIGREDGPNQLIFGEIASAGFTRRQSVIVVDRKMQDVRVFGPQGQFRQQLGRAGQGPGEFRAPHTLLVTPSDEVWIVDMQRRLTVFAPSADGYRLARTVPTSISIRSMCLLGGELVANGVSASDAFAIRVLDSLARPVRSFGPLYQSPNEVVNLQFSEGLLACDETNDLVVFATAATIGEVRAYRRDGRPVWRVALEGVRSNIINDTDGGMTVERSPDGAHALISLNIVPNVGVLLQYGFRTPAQMVAKDAASDIQTIIIDPRTGTASLASAAWPRLGAVARNQVLALFEDPAPRIEIRGWRPR